MRVLAIALLVSAALTSLPAEVRAQASKATLQYGKERHVVTEPPFGLEKVERMIANLQPSEDNVDAVRGPFSKRFNALRFQEKFTYTMIHGEQFNQSCYLMPILQGEEHMIFPYPAGPFDGENNWSDRQIRFITSNRSRMIPLIRSTIETRHQVGANLKQAILLLGANELIPDMIAVYKQGHERDQDILSTCIALMQAAKYKPFMTTSACRRLYGPNASHQSYLPADDSTRQFVMEQAMNFYRTPS